MILRSSRRRILPNMHIGVALVLVCERLQPFCDVIDNLKYDVVYDDVTVYQTSRASTSHRMSKLVTSTEGMHRLRQRQQLFSFLENVVSSYRCIYIMSVSVSKGP